MWAGFCRETPGLWDTGSGVFKQGNFLSGPGGVAGNNTSLRRGEGALSMWIVGAVLGTRTMYTLFFKLFSEVPGFQLPW